MIVSASIRFAVRTMRMQCNEFHWIKHIYVYNGPSSDFKMKNQKLKTLNAIWSVIVQIVNLFESFRLDNWAELTAYQQNCVPVYSCTLTSVLLQQTTRFILGSPPGNIGKIHLNHFKKVHQFCALTCEQQKMVHKSLSGNFFLV